MQSFTKLAIAALMTGLLTGVARSDGDLFFEAQEIAGQPEYVMFGNIKDDRGEYLEGAFVTIKVDEPMLAYTQPTDILGHYRTLDIGRAIKDLGYDVHPGAGYADRGISGLPHGAANESRSPQPEQGRCRSQFCDGQGCGLRVSRRWDRRSARS